MRHLLFTLTMTLCLAFGKAGAHEFWIDPVAYQIAPDAPLVAQLRVGESFSGVPISFIPRNFTRFEMIQGSEVTPVEGRIGDIPALDMAGLPNGLAIIAHETTASRLTYSEWDRFLAFAAHKDFADVADRHDARGLPRTGFREAYTRHAKSLVAIGDGAGSDRLIGLTTEIVALDNPYTSDVSAGLRVQVFHDGAPRPDAQVELFERAADGGARIALFRTNAAGIAVLPVSSGHDYLVDAVTLLPLEPEADTDPVWLSRWASLTFHVP